MAKKKGKKRRGRRRGSKKFTAHTSPPTKRRRFGGGGGGFSLKSLLNVGAIVEGTIIGASVVGSNIATQKLVAKVKPDLAANPYMMGAAQVVIGIAGQAALKMLGLGKYAASWMSGSVAGATLNVYGAWQAQRAMAAGGQTSQATFNGMRGLAGTFGPNNAAGFAPAGVSRMAYSA